MRALCHAAFVLIVAAACPARGAVTTYFNTTPDQSNLDISNSSAARHALVTTLSSFGVENLDGPGHAGGETDPALVFGATGITATTDFDFIVGLPQFATSGNNSLLDAGPTQGQPRPDTIVFNQLITAFGAYYVQGGDGGANTFTFTLENTLLGTSKSVSRTIGPGWPFFGVNFFGFTDTEPFNKLTLTETNDNDGLIFDDFVAGFVVVPEPNGALLGILGAALVFACWLRRRANVARAA